MRLQKLTALALTAAALALSACNDDNTPRTAVITNPTQPPVVTPPTPVVVTVGSFATDQTKAATCSNNFSADVNSVTFTDSEAAVDVETLTPGCMGGPAS